MPPPVTDLDATLLVALSLAGTFVFGLSGGMAAVRAHLDIFGVVVLAAVVGIAGGITRDLLIGVPPQTFRDGRYLAAAGAAGLVTIVGHRVLARLERPVLILDAASLALFCVTGASTALSHGVGAVEAVVVGAITGVGGGVLRDIVLLVGAAVCFTMRVAGLHFGLSLPRLDTDPLDGSTRGRPH